MAAETSSSSRGISRGAHLDDRHLAAEAAVHLGELEADVAAADDRPGARGRKSSVHHRAVGQVGDLVDAGHRRHRRRGRRR